MSRSIDFFEQPFRRQAGAADFTLNPFVETALSFLHGEILDFGCGLGNLALAAAGKGCRLVALDAASSGIDRHKRCASAAGLAIEAEVADLRHAVVARDFNAVASIGLLMFFDCGTTYLDMFDPQASCRFDRDALRESFTGWELGDRARQCRRVRGARADLQALRDADRPAAGFAGSLNRLRMPLSIPGARRKPAQTAHPHTRRRR
jgi:tellurite methyltransferase